MADFRHRLPLRHAALAAFVFGLSFFLSLPPATAQSFDANDLRALGLTRPADLLLLVAPDAFTTTDGFTWMERGSSNTWWVLVDGVPTTHALFGFSDLNRFPISLDQIERIQITRAPHTRADVPGSINVVEITTVKRSEPWLAAAAMLGNETGDPGPFQFSGSDATNVDKIGPDLSVAGGWGANLYGSFHRRKYFATDPALMPRSEALLSGYPVMNSHAGRLDHGVAPGRFRVFGSGLISRASDLPFVPEVGREHAFVLKRQRAAGGVRLGEAALHVAIDQQEGFPRSDALLSAPDFRLQRLLLRGEYRLAPTRQPGGIAETHLFGEYRHETLTFDPSGESRSRLFSFGARTGWQTERSFFGAAARATAHGNQFAFSGSITGHHTIGRVRLAAGYDFSERHLLSYAPLAYWTYRGYPLLSSPHPDLHITPALRRQHTAFLGLDTDLFQEIRARAEARLFLQPQAPHFFQRVTTGTAPLPEVTTFRWQPEGTHHTLELRASLSRWHHRFYHHLTYRFADDLDPAGPDDAWRPDGPNHQLTYAARFSPHPTFHVGSFLLLQSETYWPAYQTQLPGFVRLDLAFTKSFWQRRLETTLRFENVLNRPVRYHPLGARFDCTMYFRVALYLPSA